jgi:hypothetical protein
VTVFLTNNSPSVATIVGSIGNVYSLTFPVGSIVQVVNLLAIGPGQINITAAAGADKATLSTVNTVVVPKLVGHWLAGDTALTDKSGYTPAGTHDAIVVGANPEALVFSTDVPPGFSGESLDLTTNATAGVTVGLAVNNSASSDSGYLATFDDGLSSAFSVAFWAKGLPGGWNGFVSKRGENGIGWQVRRHGGDNFETFTIRGAALGNDDPLGSIAINDGQWHHFAAVWDGITGMRKCYIDGVLDPKINLVGDYGPMSLAPDHHVGIGARESGTPGGFETWFAGKLADVRIYNYPLTSAEVTSLVGVAPKLTLTLGAGNQLRISWPTSAGGYALQQSPAVTAGWAPSGLPVTVVGSENVVNVPATEATQFFRLKK